MENKNELASALKRIALAYILICFHFNLGPVDLLPDFVGYILIYNAIKKMSEYTKQTSLLKGFATVLCGYEIYSWFSALFGATLNGIIDIIVSVIYIYFHFQLLTDIAETAKTESPSNVTKILVCRTVYVSVGAVGAFVNLMNEYLVIALALAGVIAAVINAVTLCRVASEINENNSNDVL